MRFELTQHFHAPIDAVTAAYVDERFYAALDALPKLGRPEVLSRDESDGAVRLRVRYHFTGHLSSAVRAAIDPEKLSWVEESVHDQRTHDVTFRLLPDHYADRFACSGSYRFDATGPSATTRTCRGDIRVRMLLVGRRVEDAIVSGLREHLDDEAELLEQWLLDQSASS